MMQWWPRWSRSVPTLSSSFFSSSVLPVCEWAKQPSHLHQFRADPSAGHLPAEWSRLKVHGAGPRSRDCRPTRATVSAHHTSLYIALFFRHRQQEKVFAGRKTEVLVSGFKCFLTVVTRRQWRRKKLGHFFAQRSVSSENRHCAILGNPTAK